MLLKFEANWEQFEEIFNAWVARPIKDSQQWRNVQQNEH